MGGEQTVNKISWSSFQSSDEKKNLATELSKFVFNALYRFGCTNDRLQRNTKTFIVTGEQERYDVQTRHTFKQASQTVKIILLKMLLCAV